MEKRLILFFLCIALAGVVQAVDVSNCQMLDNSTSYELAQNITATTSCLFINVSNVDLDCKGFQITFDTSGVGSGQGIYAHGVENITINDCVVKDGNESGSDTRGILLSDVRSSLVVDNVVSVNGLSNNIGIYVFNGTEETRVTNNNITVIGNTTGAVNNWGIDIANSHYNNITQNNISTALGGSNIGIRVMEGENQFIRSNSILSTGTSDTNVGINLQYNNETIIENNEITTKGIRQDFGIYYLFGRGHEARDNVIYSRNISSISNYAIIILAIDNNTFVNNTIVEPPAWIDFGTGENNTFINTTFITDSGEIFFSLIEENKSGSSRITRKDVNISRNYVRVDTNRYSFFNVSAQVTLYNLTANEMQIQVDEADSGNFVPCTSCTLEDFEQSNFSVFNVSHFTSYRMGPFDCGTTIDRSLIITLTQNLTASDRCFVVNGENITIDGAGYAISTTGSGIGIDVRESKNITIQNLTIEDFIAGVSTSGSSNITLRELTFENITNTEVSLTNTQNADLVGQTINRYGINSTTVGFGIINSILLNFTENITQSGTNLSEHLSFSSNLINISLANASGFNSTVSVVFENTNALSLNDRYPLFDGRLCPASVCTETSDASKYTFSATQTATTIKVGEGDADNDGIFDLNDTLLGRITNISGSGFTSLNVTVNGAEINSSPVGKQRLVFRDSGVAIINFSHNFSSTSLNFSRIRITKATNSLIVNLSGQLEAGETKTLYVDDNNFASLCVKDAEISSVDQISSGCDQNGETNFNTCIGNSAGVTINNITCVDEGSRIRIGNLSFSGISGTPQSSTQTYSSGGGGGGGGGLQVIQENVDKTVSIRKGSLLYIKIGKERHKVRIKDFKDNKAIFVMGLKEFSIANNVPTKVDVNQDGAPDVTLTIALQQFNKANLRVFWSKGETVNPFNELLEKQIEKELEQEGNKEVVNTDEKTVETREKVEIKSEEGEMQRKQSEKTESKGKEEKQKSTKGKVVLLLATLLIAGILGLFLTNKGKGKHAHKRGKRTKSNR